MKRQIYKFTTEEIKKLTYRQLKVLSVIRQFNKDNKSSIKTTEIMERTLLSQPEVSKQIKSLVEKEYIIKDKKNYIINELINKETSFLFWEYKDLELNLTYNQFALYCLIRTKSIKLGYAMLKRKTIATELGIAEPNVSRTIKQLVEKNLIRTEKEKTYTKYYLVAKESIDDCDDNDSETSNIIDVLDYLTYLGLKRCEEHSSVYYRIKGFAEGFKITYDEILEIIKDEEEEFKKLSNIALPADAVYKLLDSFV